MWAKNQRAMGIEPTLSAWKAEVLPLNYARMLIKNGGGRIRTFEGVSRQIYSLIPLAAREPLRQAKKAILRNAGCNVNEKE